MIKRPNTNAQRLKRHKRVRAKISGTPECPRLNVFRSEKNIYAQVIDDVNGVGYRVQVTGNKLNMNLGYSHPVDMTPPEGVTVEAPSANKIIVSGADKQKVGQFAAEIREKRLPEPYKGKGIKYADEVIRRKEGKTGGKKK